jgi:hypothetical protein
VRKTVEEVTITVFSRGSEVFSIEGRPEEVSSEVHNVRPLTISYPNMRVTVWVIGSVQPQQTFTALQRVLAERRANRPH